MDKYKFVCGCSVNIIKEKTNGFLPDLEIDYQDILYRLNYEKGCPQVWNMLAEGKTKGVFQLESYLGKKWSNSLQPESIAEIAALVSLIRPSCISGDTRILIKIYDRFDNNKKREFVRIKIRDLYNKFKNNKKFYQDNIVSVDEINNKLLNNQIKNIIYNGNKEVFKVKVRTRYRHVKNDTYFNLECTDDHKILTYNRGYIELRNLKIGDRIAVKSAGQSLRFHNNKVYTRYEKSFQDICYLYYEYKCIFCDIQEITLDVHHIDGNRKTNNHPDNLCFVCPNHHRLIHQKNIDVKEIKKLREKYTIKNTDEIIWGIYDGKESLGVKDVYDISVEGPNHNFLAGNIVVHNCLQAISEGKSMTQHYVDRKRSIEPVTPLHPSLSKILEETYQIMVYQEDAILISQYLAGFSEEESDSLRRAIGKKLADLMTKVRTEFLIGCNKTNIVDNKAANQIFDWIQESQRYSFNKCISGNTLCQTRNRYKTVESISIGEEILSPYGFVKVLNKYKNGIKLCYTYILDDFKQIECTEDHKVQSYKNLLTIEECFKNNLKIMTYNGYRKIIYKSDPYFIETMDIEVDHWSHLFYGNGIAISNSHAVSYGQIAYLTGFVKQHFPLHFFCSWLKFAREKMDVHEEIKELIEEAKLFKIPVLSPNISSILNNDSDVCIDKKILRFGLRSMKSVGESTILKIQELITSKIQELNKNITDWTWEDILYHILPNINMQSANALITGGVLDQFGLSRSRMLLEFQKIKEVSKKQLSLLQENNLPLIENLEKVEEKVSKPQKEKLKTLSNLLKNTTHEMSDRIGWVISQEKNIYGVSITYNPIDVLKNSGDPDTTCKEFLDGKDGHIRVCGEIDFERKFKIKTGKNAGKMMATFKINDGTAIIDCVLFQKYYDQYEKVLYKGNLVVVSGKRSDSNSLMADTIEEIY